MMYVMINLYDGNKYEKESKVVKKLSRVVAGYAVRHIPKEVILRDFDESCVDDNDEYLELTYPDGTTQVFGTYSTLDIFDVRELIMDGKTTNRKKGGMTNFEWITQDERMVAIWLAEIGCDTCPAYTYCDKLSETVDKSCFATLCSWLKCDAKEEEIGAEIYKI